MHALWEIRILMHLNFPMAHMSKYGLGIFIPIICRYLFLFHFMLPPITHISNVQACFFHPFSSYRLMVTLCSSPQLFIYMIVYLFIYLFSLFYRELPTFIAARWLNCKIRKTSGVLETNRSDSKNSLYQPTIKQCDLVLNRVQKLSQGHWHMISPLLLPFGHSS